MSFISIKTLLGIALGWVVSFLAPIYGFLIITFCLVMCDAYTGIKAAKKRGEEIMSKGLRRTTEKFVLYAIAILLARGIVIAFEIPAQYFPLVYIVSGWIAYHELKSNYENISEVTGVDLWTRIKQQLHSFLKPKEK